MAASMAQQSAAGAPDEPATPRRGSLLVIFLTVFVDLLGFGIVLPLLPIYGEQFARQHGLTAAQTGWVVGLLMASFSIMQFFFLPLWGRLSDLYGRRPILLLGLAGSTLFYTLFGMATVWQSLVWLFVARIGAGVAGATISTAQAYIADSTTAGQRTKGMALIGAAFALGFTLGPLIGAVALLFGTQADVSPWPGYFAAGLSGTALVLALWLLPESRTGVRREQAGDEAGSTARRSLLDLEGLHVALTTSSIGLLLLSSFIVVLSLAAFESTLSLAIKTLLDRALAAPVHRDALQAMIDGARRLGYHNAADVSHVIVLATFAYLGLVMTIAQGFLVRRLAGRVADGAMAVGGALIATLSLVLLSVAVRHDSYGLLCTGMAVFVVGLAFVTPSLQSLVSRRTSPAQQGHVLGVAQSLSSFARIAGPVLGIRLFTFSPQVPLWSAAAIMAVAVLFTVAAVRSGSDHGVQL
jgi:MFS transporter, DHA1 family, tetracycline resistance protein